jgi:hypothetical protein
MSAVQAIREALELAGIEFIDENGGGPSVRLRKRQRAKKPNLEGRAEHPRFTKT